MQRRRRNLIAFRPLLALLGLFSLCASAQAQKTRAEYQYLRQARTYLHFEIHDGRIAVGVLKTGTFAPRTSNIRGRKEQVAVRYDYRDGSANFHYHLASPDEVVTVTAATSGHVVARCEPGPRSRIPPSEFVQPPSGPLVLTIGRDAEKKTITAPTIWHLLLTHRQAASEYVIPWLRILRPDWQLAERADDLEKELTRAAALGKLPDRRRWAALVAQLADDRFARREAADRQLRSAGPAVLAYLKGLDRDKLEPEQQVRVHRIIESLSAARGDESPRQAAAAMLTDPTIWLVLLEHNSLATRQAAAAHLARLLGTTIDFNPAADPPTRTRQLEALRQRLAQP